MSAEQSFFLQTILDQLYVKPCFTGNLKACQEQGSAASSQAFGRDQNPYPIGSAEREWWDAGHSEETEELTGENQ